MALYNWPGSYLFNSRSAITERVLVQRSTNSELEASTITLSSGSVPEARTKTLPSVAISAYAWATASTNGMHFCHSLRRSRFGTCTFCKRCG